MSTAATIARVGRAGLAGFILFVLSAPFAEAEYGPRTTLGNNYQQTSSMESTNGINAGSCDGSILCYVLFQRVPQDKKLILQHVSCYVSVDVGSEQVVFARLMSRKGQAFPLRHTALVLPRDGNTKVVNSQVMHLITSNERPLIYFTATSSGVNWTAECNISGKLLPP